MAEIKNVNSKVLVGLIAVLLVVAGAGLTFLFVAGLTYLVCLGFGLEWSWWLALGVWAAIALLRYVISAAKPNTK